MIKQIFHILSPDGRKQIIFSIIGFVSYALCSVAIVLISLVAIKSGLERTLNLAALAGVLAGVLAVKTMAGILADKQKHRAGFDLTFQIRCRIVTKLKTLSLGYYTKSRLGEISEIIHKDVDNMELIVGHLWTRMTADMTVSALLILGLAGLDWRLTLFMIATLPAAVAWLAVGLRQATRLESQVGDAGAQLASLFVEYVRGIPLLKAFSRCHSLDILLSDAIEDFGSASTQAARNRAFVLSIYNLVVNLSFLFAVTSGLWLTMHHNLDIFRFLVFIVLAPELYKPFFALEEHWMNYLKAKDSFTRILKITQATAVIEPTSPVAPHEYGIEFKQVTFSYEPGRPTLENVSFTVPPGTLCALVGETGAGKTTVANLLLRFWDVDTGVITIGGKDIRNIPYDEMLAHISIVMQNVQLFADTVAGNIRIGKSGASDEEIVNAAKAARIHDFIMSLPAGYDTMLGENGTGLSGGQRQRLSVARAFLKDAPIVVLDEPTANVDSLNEALMQEAISALAQDRTVMVIAHHLSTVRSANQILVFHEGHIVQQGTHEELLRDKNGRYRKMWNQNQAATGVTVTTPVPTPQERTL